jgi:hypothetical protein
MNGSLTDDTPYISYRKDIATLPPSHDADVMKFFDTLQHGTDDEAAAAIAAWPFDITDDACEYLKPLLLDYTRAALSRSPLSATVLRALVQAGYTPTQLLWAASNSACEVPSTYEAILETFGAAADCGWIHPFGHKESLLHRVANWFGTEQGAALVELLVRHGAPRDAKTVTGETALDWFRALYPDHGIANPRVLALLA